MEIFIGGDFALSWRVKMGPLASIGPFQHYFYMRELGHARVQLNKLLKRSSQLGVAARKVFVKVEGNWSTHEHFLTLFDILSMSRNATSDCEMVYARACPDFPLCALKVTNIVRFYRRGYVTRIQHVYLWWLRLGLCYPYQHVYGRRRRRRRDAHNITYK